MYNKLEITNRKFGIKPTKNYKNNVKNFKLKNKFINNLKNLLNRTYLCKEISN